MRPFHVFKKFYSYFRYLTLNAKMSTSVVDTLTPDVPGFLRNRPHWFVRHCLTRIRNADELSPNWVTQITEDSFQVSSDNDFLRCNHMLNILASAELKLYFQVRSSRNDDTYSVELTGCFPRCTCVDWFDTELPCKHIFHVLTYSRMGWDDLPEVFRFAKCYFECGH